jgi:hypothetical protein
MTFTRRRTAAAAAALVLVVVAAGCGSSGGGGDEVTVPTTIPVDVTGPPATTSGPPTVLAIVSPAVGASVGGNVVRLDVTTSGISIVPANGDTSGRTGHFHVFIDRDPPPEPGALIPVAAGIIHTTDDPIVIPGLAVGPHRISVVFGDGSHHRIGFSEAGTSFTVTGPSIHASTPPNAPARPPVVITVTGEGLPADGHVDAFVDRDPAVVPGQPIPEEPGIVHAASLAEVSVPDLAPGTHVIWLVAGDAAHVPLDPPVMDKVTVTVG